MPQVCGVVFSMSVITRIESIGGGRGGVDGGGSWGVVDGLKQTFKQKWQCCAISRRPRLAQLEWCTGLPSESVWHPMQSY